ncbi:OmpA Outer membrane protein and related peptidoglycan-associated (lipo)proteins [Methylophilaceae bacterium]
MNSSTWNTKLLSSLALALILAACKSTPMVDKPAAVEDRSPVAASAAKPAEAAPAAVAETAAVKEVVIDGNAGSNSNNPLKDPNNILSKRQVYFDYDSDAVKAEYRPLIEAHAKYLLANRNAKVIVQGNTDERGSREYNLSLGQRRSVAVKKSLNLLGVQDGQIETVSFGEEKATAGCADEACTKQNRRANIVYENE